MDAQYKGETMNFARQTYLTLIVLFSIVFSNDVFAATEKKGATPKKIIKQLEWPVSETKLFGLGLQLGAPLGITAKYWLPQSKVGIRGLLGTDTKALTIFVDALYHFKNVASLDIPFENGQLAVYIGAGPEIRLRNQTRLGLRVPFGFNNLFANKQWDAFAEFVPVIRLLPSAGAYVDIGLGMRYYF